MPTHLRIRLQLRKSEPPITRVLEIPADYSAYEFHLALQVSLGWNDREPFEIVRPGLTVGIEPSYAGEGITHEEHRYRHADEVEARELFATVGQTINYTYDFSRLWEFHVTLLELVERDSELPTCTEVFEAAPIEDADDLDAFYGMLIAYRDPSIHLHDLAKELLGEDFDEHGPHADDVTAHLAELFGEEVEPNGTEAEDDDWGWWDPSKYDDKMRLRVKQEEIQQELPRGLRQLDAGAKHAELLRVLRGGRGV